MRRPIRAPIAAVLAALLACLPLLLLGALPAAAQAVFPNQGSVGLEPPPGMVEIPGVSGFENRGAQAAILILEVPAAAYDDVIASFRPEALQGKNITIENKRDFDLANGSKGMLFSGYQSVGAVALKKWILVARNDTTAAMVTVQFPEAATAGYSDAMIEAALRSLTFRAPPTQDEMLARLPFSIANMEGYHVLKVLGASAVLLVKGEGTGPDAVVEHPYFIASVARGDVREEERDSLAKRAIATVPGVKNLRIERGGPLRIGGQPGIEVIASAEEVQSGKPLKVAQWIRFSRGNYLRMVGVAPADSFDANFDAMRGLRDGIELR
ncbi:hypothetical protein FHS55_001188 [Angulomicrobium tetraedrale]|uniref:Uncharacterized protein n=1 Tax=Ancylobacter tetraedralis TaxID=217068 RepID=A0A839Z6D0_9HYPH|nr:hypothetical protein [Ancylobacter tetraedralis]MBB3770593.1 hypothetical protein [Ancylobacter tetraedralis]